MNFKKLRMIVAGAISMTAMLAMIGGMYLFRKHNRWWRLWWCQLTVWLSGSNVSIEGAPDPAARLYVLNHRSLLDIILLEALLPKTLNPCWIAKKEIAKIPIFGRILDAPKMLVIDRENSREMVKLLKKAQEPLDEGRPLMIFPEGTRNKGGGLLPFKAGAKMLAEKHNLLVQPVVIKGTDDRFHLERGVTSGPVYVRYLSAIDPSEAGWYEKLADQMQTVYNSLPETR